MTGAEVAATTTHKEGDMNIGDLIAKLKELASQYGTHVPVITSSGEVMAVLVIESFKSRRRIKLVSAGDK